LWILSIAQNSEQLEHITFRKLDLLTSSGEGEETPILLDGLERANLNHCIWLALSKGYNKIDFSLLSSEHEKRYSLPKVIFQLLSILDDGQRPQT
jgi:hypothetical protein